MKEITYFCVRILAILLFGKGILLLEALYHGIMATYFETDELVRMTYPSIVYLLFSVIIWFSAKRITRILSKTQINNKGDLDKNDLKELMMYSIGVLYLITTIPDIVLFVGQSIAYIDFMGLGYMSKVDAVIFLLHFSISLFLIRKPKTVVRIMNKVIRPFD